jgi:uncharacterized protein HemX
MSDKDKDLEPLGPDEETPAVEEPGEAPSGDIPEQPVVAAPEEPGEDVTPDERATAPVARGNATAFLALLVAAIALAAAGYLGWQDWRSAGDTSAADDYARLGGRLDTTDQRYRELEKAIDELRQREVASPAELDALRRSVQQQLGLVESVPGRLSTLESSIAALAGISEGARDAWILAEAEYYMQIANAQLQLANNPQLAALALRLADERIAQMANPALTEVRRAIADELAALDVMAKPDIEGATLTLASLARVVESLPLAGVPAAETDEANATEETQSGVSRAWGSVKNAMSGLVRVTPPEQARLVRLSPDAEYFLRNNIALQLQAARLALLRGEQVIFEQTLDDAKTLLSDYFDTQSEQVISAHETLDEIRGSVLAADPPDISESLRLLRQHRTLQESAQ